MTSPGELMRTYDGKFTMAEWWRRAENAQRSFNKRAIFEQFFGPGDLVFDIGANRGMMTLVFRWIGAVVVAVEPLLSAAPKLVQEFAWKFREDGNVIPVAKALTDRQRIVHISVQKNLPYLSSCARDWMTESAHAKMYNARACRAVPVAGTTFDELIELFGQPKFIKLDVEGYESTVIRGLTAPIQALNFEFHQDWLHDARQVMQHLALIGKYEYNYVLDNRNVFALSEWLPSRDGLIEHLQATLTKKGKGSWGDIYARLT